MGDAENLRRDALAIWRAGVAAVDSRRLVLENVRVESSLLWIGDHTLDLDNVRRIAVVGGGKAGAGMAAGLIEALGEALCYEKQVHGRINVPDDCIRPLPFLQLHAARPAGVNEPTPRGVEGVEDMLRTVTQLGEQDLCLCLLSGGGSALLPAPLDQVPLEEKLLLTRHLSAAGANIQQLNTVRKQLSRIKGGRLAAACGARRMFVLIISDVIGDPLDVIASGPTTPDPSTADDALEVLQLFDALQLAPRATASLQAAAANPRPVIIACDVEHLIIGNNAVAVDAAGAEAERRGYHHAMIAGRQLEGAAEDVGRHHAQMALSMREANGPDCLITGGEPTVRLAPAEQRGRGGRNQQMALAALEYLQTKDPRPGEQIVVLSGGTDGEDGPTDAAGAFVDAGVIAAAAQKQLDAREFLARNDAYHFFQQTDSLIQTGPTHTNVCDVRVVLVRSAAGRL